MRVPDGSLQATFDGLTSNETLARREDGVDQPPDTPAPFHFPCQFFHDRAVTTETPNGGDVGPHAASGDRIHLNPVFFQDLDDTDVRQPFRATGGQRQTDSAPTHFPRQPAQVRVKSFTGCGALTCSVCGRRWTIVNK